MDAELQVKELVARARVAQKEFEKCTQEQVDEACRIIAKTVFDNAEPLARMAVEETRMGVVEDKIKKNQGKARVIWTDMKGGKSVGIIDRDPEKGLIMVAKPMGVVGACTPTTNPIVTPMCNAMFALKGRNAVVICPHPRSKKCSSETIRLCKEALKALDYVPQDLIQIIEDPTVELSGQVMKQCDVCISTGGAAMVRAAYASGKPAFGCGAGNVQCMIDEGVDLEKVIPMIIAGRIFDNGIICSGEQTAIMPKSIFADAVEIFKKNGALYIDKPEDVQKLRDVVFPNGTIDKNIVGVNAATIADRCGFAHGDIKVILVKTDKFGRDDVLSKEKMCPMIATYDFLDTWEDCIKVANANLEYEGKGHSVSIHSENQEHIEAAAQVLPVSRFLINQICSTNNGGSFFNSLNATTTLGCGSWGNNSISENLSWRHLFNVSRIATVRPGSAMPTDAEIWGE